MLQNQESESVWYAAHLLFYLEPVERAEREIGRVTVWENIYLLHAGTSDAAYDLADAIGAEGELSDIDSGHTADGKSVRWRYAGVRRMAECLDIDKRPESGAEITYLEYTVRDKTAIDALLAERSCVVIFEATAYNEKPPEILANVTTQNIIKLLDVVALMVDLPEHQLSRGQVGTVVEELAANVYEVEFLDAEGRAYAMLALKAEQMMPLCYEPARVA